MAHSTDDHVHLQTMSEHLLYEINQFEFKGNKLLEMYSAKQGQFAEYIRHSVFESFLIHARILFEFLFRDKTYPKDIRANDFKEDEDYIIPQSIDENLNRWAKFMIDKRLVHLTEDRLEISQEDSEWQIGEIFMNIHSQLLKFYRWVPDEHVCQLLNDKKEYALQELVSSGKPVSPVWSSSIVMGTAGSSMPVIIGPNRANK